MSTKRMNSDFSLASCCHSRKPCRNRQLSDRNAVSGSDSRGPRNHVLVGECTLAPPGGYDGGIFVAAAMRPYAIIIVATS